MKDNRYSIRLFGSRKIHPVQSSEGGEGGWGRRGARIPRLNETRNASPGRRTQEGIANGVLCEGTISEDCFVVSSPFATLLFRVWKCSRSFIRLEGGGGGGGGARLFCRNASSSVLDWRNALLGSNTGRVLLDSKGKEGRGGGGRESGRACTRSLTVVNEEARDDRRNKGLRISEDVSYIVGKEL